MTTVITGVAGMIGSNLAHWLIDNTEHEVVGIDNLSGGYKSNMPKNDRFVFIQADVLDVGYLNALFSINTPDIVYHAAAYAAENLSPFIRNYNYTNNVVGTANIVNACINHDVKRLVFFSSIAVYGHGNPPFKETDIPTPNDPYGIAKYACEMDIRVAGEQHGLDWCIVRPFNVYGKRQNIKDKYRNVLGIFINQYLNQKPFTVFGDGSQVRCFTNVEDLMTPLYNAGVLPEASKRVFNLGSKTKWTVKEAADILKTVVLGGEIKYLDGRHEVHTAFADNYLAVQVLKYKDTISLYDGMRDMYEWVLKNPTNDETQTPNYEITKGMYNAWKN